MIYTSDRYKYIQSQKRKKFEYVIDIPVDEETTITLTTADIKSCKISRDLYSSDSAPTIGGTPSAQMKLTFKNTALKTLPRGAKLIMRYRLNGYDLASTLPSDPLAPINHEEVSSEWINYFTGYISSRDVGYDFTTLTCYDEMQRLNKPLLEFYEDGEPIQDLEFPLTLAEVVDYIVTEMGITLDSDTYDMVHAPPWKDYGVEYPNDRTMRSVLGSIASALCGNFVFTANNALKLIPLKYSSQLAATELKNYDSAHIGKPVYFSRLTLQWSGTGSNYFTAGSDVNEELSASCYFATQEMADNAYALIQENVSIPIIGFYAKGVRNADPAIELGDTIVTGFPSDNDPEYEYATPVFSSNLVVVASMSWRFGDDAVADFSAPIPSEDDEYPFVNTYTEALKQRVILDTPYEGVKITRQEGLNITNTNNNYRVIMNSRGVAFQTNNGSSWKNNFYYNAETGTFDFDGRTSNLMFRDETGNYVSISQSFAGMNIAMMGNLNNVYNYITQVNGEVTSELRNQSTYFNTQLNIGLNGLSLNISDLSNNVNTRFQATNNKLSYLITEPNGQTATNFTITNRLIELMAEHLNINGIVTFLNGLESGTTTISGDTVRTGTIIANKIDVINLNVSHMVDTENTYVLDVYTNRMVFNSPNIQFSQYPQTFMNSDRFQVGHAAVFQNTLTMQSGFNSINSGNMNLGEFIISLQYNFQNNYFLANSYLGGSTQNATVSQHLNSLYTSASMMFNSVNSQISSLNSSLWAGINSLNSSLQSTASSINGRVNSAYNQANSAYSQANSAYTAANQAYSLASSISGVSSDLSAVKNSMNSMNTNISSAYSQANNAYSLATSANNLAYNANSRASDAYNRANSAYNLAGSFNVNASSILSTSTSTSTYCNISF